ncbi:hypothetical protein BpHYR1_040255 [Brachionus plicatilis]|uniref:Uncharacterized protein n=1 Tax=Brachionus plicatilis TaxID=10195 RepID=A0A3M7RSV0_BRAPC|nr:hypothetical protein BpHYR1_040255 [Brachionus plicatilis]
MSWSQWTPLTPNESNKLFEKEVCFFTKDYLIFVGVAAIFLLIFLRNKSLKFLQIFTSVSNSFFLKSFTSPNKWRSILLKEKNFITYKS